MHKINKMINPLESTILENEQANLFYFSCHSYFLLAHFLDMIGVGKL
jgi:hypothetical protein